MKYLLQYLNDEISRKFYFIQLFVNILICMNIHGPTINHTFRRL